MDETPKGVVYPFTFRRGIGFLLCPETRTLTIESAKTLGGRPGEAIAMTRIQRRACQGNSRGLCGKRETRICVRSESEAQHMLNDMMQWENHTANMTTLSVNNYDEYYEASDIAEETGRRFVRAAGMLPENAFLGWQVNVDKEGRHRVFAFSDGSAGAAREDFGWIFHKCAAAEDKPAEPMDVMGGEGRRIYALRTLSGDLWDGTAREDAVETGRFQDLFDMLRYSGAAVRITACADCGGSGAVFIGLPGEMPLRMRAMLSLAVPNTEAAEIKSPEDIGRFPAGVLEDIMTGLLEMLMLERPAQSCTEDPGEEFPDTVVPEDWEDFAPIEELDLSVRSFNCLKRAGVDTVGELRAMKEDELLHVRNLSRKCVEEIKKKLAGMGALPASEPVEEPDWSGMLEGLIGLENVKEQVRKITALAKLKKDMEAMGRASLPVVLNMEFVGNPGTAKTTVARIVAGLFHQIGLLPDSGLVEVGRADLVAQYVGQTADNVKSVFRRAKGKVLFIDEAYSLVDGREGSFGDEAINTIVQEMENHRDETVVIFAGYPDKMEAFFARNPGLRSRVPFCIGFADYSAEEMVQIAELEAKKRGFSVSPEAKRKVADICGAAGRPDRGNGRFCRNLVESAILGYALRVYGSGGAACPDFVLTDEDFTVPDMPRPTEKTVHIGFAA